jgi:hypothetical protein
MINPLNELSSVYLQNIAEDCGKCSCGGKGCSKCDKKRTLEIKGSGSVDGGDEAKPGKDKNYVKPMATEEKKEEERSDSMPKGDVGYDIHKRAIKQYNKQNPSKKVAEEKEESKIGGGNLKKLATKANKRIDADVDGDVDTDDPKSTEMGEFIPSADGKKKVKTKARFESAYSNWKDESQDLLEYVGSLAGVDGENNLQNPKAKTDTKAGEKITEKNVKNKILINPPQGMVEAFAEFGGVITEMYEISEKIDIAKADMGDVVKDFRKSDAPQFKGKSDKKKQQMAVAAKLATEETDEDKKKRDLETKTKEHDDKRSGKLAEADMTGAPSIKDAKPAKKTNVKYDPHMKVMAPTIKKEGRALAGVLSTIRAKNGMGTVTAKGADKLQDKKDKAMGEEMSVKDQMADTIKYNKMNPRNPNPDHRAIRGKMLKKPLPKDTRPDDKKMTDATGPRPGSNYRGD